jgi:hypothetical protein
MRLAPFVHLLIEPRIVLLGAKALFQYFSVIIVSDTS